MPAQNGVELTANKWMNSLHDDTTDVFTVPACVDFADLHGEGDTKLIVANIGSRKNMKLKVFKGVTLIAESTLADIPMAISAFINEQSTLPSIAVASGPSLLIYKNLRPFYKFTVPFSPIHPIEEEAWNKTGQQELSHEDLFTVIHNLSKDISPKKMTPVSQTLLNISEEHRSAFIEKYAQNPLTNPSPLTCVSTMKKSTAAMIDVLVCGTERGSIYVVDSQAFNTIATTTTPSPPTQLVPYGVFDIDYRIFVSTRSSQIFSIKRNVTHVEKPIITCKANIVAFTRVNKMLVVGCADHSLSFYSFKGKQLNSIILDGPIKDLQTFTYAPKQFAGVLVMMQNQIRLFNDQFLLDVIRMERNLQWMKYGQFGREEGALIIGTKDGGLHVKLFRRRASLDEKLDLKPHPLAHNIKLNIPKKTKVFIDQTLREREHGSQINNMYQKDLFLLRHETTSAFASITSSALASVSLEGAESVDISVDVNGFGPSFRLTIRLSSSSKTPLYNMWLSIVGGEDLYRFETSLIPVCILTPGHFYTFTTLVECLNPEKAQKEEIRVLLIKEDRRAPIVTAIITMPMSEFSLLD